MHREHRGCVSRARKLFTGGITAIYIERIPFDRNDGDSANNARDPAARLFGFIPRWVCRKNYRRVPRIVRIRDRKTDAIRNFAEAAAAERV